MFDLLVENPPPAIDPARGSRARLRRVPAEAVDTLEVSPSATGRLRWMLAAFAAMALTVYVRLIAIEVHDGDDYRAALAEPIVRKRPVAGMRGRILARDGAVLAYDQPVVSLALQYRWFQEPADMLWLRRTARARLTAAQRRDKTAAAKAQQQVLDQRRELAQSLASLCSLNEDQWAARTARIQRRIETIAGGVNARHQQSAALPDELDGTEGLPELIGRSIVEALFALDDPLPANHITVTEELSEHVVFEGLSLAAVAEIEANPARYPGVKLVHSFRRAYPEGDLAAHALGYLGVVRPDEIDATDDAGYQADDLVGRSGVERQYEALLRGRRGLTVEQLDARGNVKQSKTVREAASGRDIVLSIDSALTRSAQTLLDQALSRRLPSGNEPLDRSAGGAVVVLDVHDGAILAAASAPRFDPNAFVQRLPEVSAWLNDSARPLFDRTAQMAIPPGSVFKIVSAAAVLDAGIDFRAPVDCRGYLHSPAALRCELFARRGIGHGPVGVVDALARSCNVYFFHQAEQLGIDLLVDWSRRFGIGQQSGVDLPGEAAGALALSAMDQNASAADRASNQRAEARLLSIGQGPVTATPLQIARMVTAVANGGRLVTPHVAERVELSNEDDITRGADDLLPPAPARPVPGLDEHLLAPIRKGLWQVVADDQGSAHATVQSANIAIAGKTGTAETGGGRPSHSWFVGYAPADNPQVAFVVVLEHAGSGATAAGPVAKLLVERMTELDYFSSRAR